MLAWRAALVAAVLLFTCAITATAQDITLTSRDGSVTVHGMLMGYDGEFYRINSVYGVLTVDGSGVTCSGPACPDLTDYVAQVRISGEAEATQILLPALIEAFAVREGYNAFRKVAVDGSEDISLLEVATGRKSARFALRTKTSQETLADLISQDVEIAISAREVSPGEVASGLEAGVGAINSGTQSAVLALDALVPVVAFGSPLATIKLSDLMRVLSGDLANWQDLGGPDAPIYLHLPERGSALSALIENSLVMPSQGARMPIERHESTAALADAVARDPFALGIATLSESGNSKTLVLADGCQFHSHATAESLKAEDYPLTAPVFLYLPQRRLPAIGRDFLRFLRSPAAQHTIRRAGFVDQSLTETPINQQGNRLMNAIRSAGPEVDLPTLQQMTAALDGFNRLSLSYRFDDGSTVLDAQSLSNIRLLAQAIEAGFYDGRTLALVGFSDGEGDSAANLRLSVQRAASVRGDLIKAAGTADFTRVKLETLGFGEAMPMACDDTDWGRRINRRVEVWVQ